MAAEAASIGLPIQESEGGGGRGDGLPLKAERRQLCRQSWWRGCRRRALICVSSVWRGAKVERAESSGKRGHDSVSFSHRVSRQWQLGGGRGL